MCSPKGDDYEPFVARFVVFSPFLIERDENKGDMSMKIISGSINNSLCLLS